VCFGQDNPDSSVAATLQGGGELLEQYGKEQVKGDVTFAADFLAPGAGKVSFAHFFGTFDQNIKTLLDPLSGGNNEEKGLIQASGCGVIDNLQRGIQPQLSFLQPHPEPAVAQFGRFLI